MPLRIPCPPAPTSAIIAPLPSRIHTAHHLVFEHRPPIRPQRLTKRQCTCLHSQPCPVRSFHASARLLRRSSPLDSKNHYQRLNLEPSASHIDIKKSFYSLSKIHHPDANPSDPDAASTFSLLSESYTILSDPSRRAAYDRDVLHINPNHHPHHATHHPHASYHSTNPAGGRAPSGLSRRRGTFRGPPPSFFRSGGYGPHADKRRKAHDDSTAGAASAASSANANSHANSYAGAGANYYADSSSNPNASDTGSTRPGMGPGADPFHFHFHRHYHGNDDVPPYFDRNAHTRTHQREDVRRWRRARTALGDDGLEFEPQTSLVGHFFIVAGILAATFLAPVAYLQVMRLGVRKKDDD